MNEDVRTSSAAGEWWAGRPWSEAPEIPPEPTLFSLFVEAVLVAACLALLLWAVDFVLRALGRGRLDPRVLPLAWTLFGFGVLLRWVQFWPDGSWMVAVAAAALVVPVMWTAGWDALVGPWVQAHVREGSVVHVGGMEGRVRALRVRGIEVESEGWIRFVPYRALLGSFAVRPTTRRSAFAVQLEVDAPAGADLTKAQERLCELVLCSPWASLEARPRVELLHGTDDRVRIRVEAATFTPQGVAALQGHVRRAWREEAGLAPDRPAR